MSQARRTSADPVTPLTQDLRTRIRRQVIGRSRPGDRLPSEAVLARQMGCSVGSIRKALAVLADEGLVVRRHGSGTYASDAIPRQSGTTGLVFYGTPRTFITDHYSQESYHGILAAADAIDRHIHIVMARSAKPFGLAGSIRRRIDTSALDSIICLEIFEHTLMGELAAWLPTVAMDFECQQRGVSSCSLDHAQNMDVAVEHLWRLGHRRIGMIGWLSRRHSDPAIPARVSGFSQGLQRRGLPIDPEWFVSTRWADEVVAVIRRWKAAPRSARPTAFLCEGQFWSYAHACVQLGIAVPGDLSLLSHDREHFWLTNCEVRRGQSDSRDDVSMAITGQPTDPLTPELAPLRNMAPTALDLPFGHMGQWAVDEIQRRLSDPEALPRHEKFPTGLIPGNSVGPANTP
ncbi:MAG: HTH-type transcriptional repressor PurR [Phycisphaerae bacterium]|nr:HTH-type transcriptional repressor PurR [Phycisphaerae bacterium]